MTRWVLAQIKPESPLEAQMTKVKLSCVGHVMRRQRFPGNTIRLGETEGSREGRRPNMDELTPLKKT